MKKISTLIVLSLITLILINTSALAATLTSSQSGNWNSSSTWGGVAVPGPSDIIIIDGGFNVSVDVSTAVCSSLQIGGSAVGSGDGTLTFTNGSRLTISGMVTFGVGNRKGNASMAAGGFLSCEGFIANSVGTWTHGLGTVEFTASNTLPNNGISSFNNLVISGGTTIINANTTVANQLLINPAGTLNGAAKQITLSGNWINNGTFNGNTGTVIFDKNGNQTISGTGLNNFNLIKLVMGSSISNTLEVLSTHFNAPDGFLTLSGGTFKVSGAFIFSNTFLAGPIYNLQPTDGLWINNPNVTVTAQAGGVSLRGLLRITAGAVNIGTAVDHNLDYVTGASLIIEGGELNIAGHFAGNNATSSISFTQSGGIISVVNQGSTDPVFAGFDLGAPASSFTVSGGTILISNATSAPVDYLNAATAVNVSGGTLQIGAVNTLNEQTIRIQSPVMIGNLLVSDATSQAVKPTAKLVTSSLDVIGNINLQSGTALNANGLNIILGGNWINNGNFVAGPNVTFNGSGPQNITNSNSETFNGLTVNKPVSTLTLNNSVSVNAAFVLSAGTLAVGSNTLSLKGSVAGGGILTSAVTGTVSYSQEADGQNMLAADYGNLIFNNFNKTIPPSSIIGVAGTFSPGTATGHNITGSTFDFNGGSQPVPAFTYNHIILSGSGTKTGSGTITANGNLTNNTGILFTGTTDLNLYGTTNSNNGTLSAATLLVGQGATFSNNATANATDALTGAGSVLQTATGILNIGGTADITTLNTLATGNIVNYTGADQQLRSADYYHLNLSGTGTATMTGVSSIRGNFTLSGSVSANAVSGLTIGGNFSIGDGATFRAGSFSHLLSGNFINTGTFTSETSTFTFNGTSPQTIGGATFYTLTINNANGVALSGDITAGNALTLANGNFSISAHTLTLNGDYISGSGLLSGGTTSNLIVGGSSKAIVLPAITLNNFTLNRANGVVFGGDAIVNGTLSILAGTATTGLHTIMLGPLATLSEAAGQTISGNVTTTRNVVSTSGTETFGNIGADIILNGVATGTTTVLRKTGTTYTGAEHSSIKRYFNITPTINTGLKAGLAFHYDLSEINGQSQDALEIYRSHDGGTIWNNIGGTVNTSQQTINVSGLNDFSGFTASDTINRLGNTSTPVLTGITPVTKGAGDAAFMMTLTGSEFVEGKSVIRINGISKPTTFVNSTQLTTLIPGSDLLVMGTSLVSVFNLDGGGLSASRSFTVTAGAPVTVNVETAANGSGTTVQSQSLASGSSISVYAITRDSFNNFVANVAAGSWALVNASSGIVAADLVAAADGKSAVFTAHVVGVTGIIATTATLEAVSSGNISVIAGEAIKVNVETAADGTGEIVPDQTIILNTSLSVYAISRDAAGNYISNVAADTWSLENVTGRFQQIDLVASSDLKSAVFTGNSSGSATIKVTSGTLVATASGTITIESATGISETSQKPTIKLLQNYPNPFINSTTLSWELPVSSHVIITIYTLQGKETATLVDETQDEGMHTLVYTTESSMPAGIYLVKLQAGNYSAARKMYVSR